MIEKPAFFYIFRRRSHAENCTAQVVVISSWTRLTARQLREEMENTTHLPPEDFEEEHLEPDASMVLDTWEPAIEHCKPTDMDFPAVKTYAEWWREELLTPTAVY